MPNPTSAELTKQDNELASRGLYIDGTGTTRKMNECWKCGTPVNFSKAVMDVSGRVLCAGCADNA